MSYTKNHIKIFNTYEWYNKAYKEYKKYHKYLSNFDKNMRKRFLPREIKNQTIVDLWCWNWRISDYFLSNWVKEYLCIDISDNMLKEAKNSLKKIKHDLNKKFPIKDNYADVILCLFVLLHIENIDLFFEEIYRILKKDWIFILFHHIERKNHIYWTWHNKFKIQTYKWNYDYVKKKLEYNFFTIKVVNIIEKWIIIWKYFICKK